jgi:hypothetical protein
MQNFVFTPGVDNPPHVSSLLVITFDLRPDVSAVGGIWVLFYVATTLETISVVVIPIYPEVRGMSPSGSRKCPPLGGGHLGGITPKG